MAHRLVQEEEVSPAQSGKLVEALLREALELGTPEMDNALQKRVVVLEVDCHALIFESFDEVGNIASGRV